jgi:hypothetical protein
MSNPKNPYNGTGRLDNCGFCAISYGLHLQQRKQVDAEKLFRETMARLKIEGDFPWTLLFNEANLDQIPTPTHRTILSTGTRSPHQYTIQHVATESGLKYDNGFPEYLWQYAQIYNAFDYTKALQQMATVRHNNALDAGRIEDNPDTFYRDVTTKLMGDAIVGSITGRHFLNVRISPSGLMEGFDPQVNEPFPGRDLLLRVRGPISLFMRLPPGR